jgi:hypothetical protein
MNYKSLVVVLGLSVYSLTAGVVEAGEPENCKDGWCIYADITKAWSTESSNIIATCDEHYRNCQVIEPEAFPCYQRMQSAMKAMDRAGSKSMLSMSKLSDWQQTMRDCVHGARP